jgi:protein-S-isoprenylcysteine O-methyltransferase Ste14
MQPLRRPAPPTTRTGVSAWLRQRVRVGLPLGIVCAWLASPTPTAVAFGAGVAAVGLSIRAVAASHLHKNVALTTSGPYAFTRNPLYLGTAAVAAGLLVAAHSWTVALLGAAYFIAFYPAAMRSEERKMRARYGSAFDAYAARVPLFWPRLPPAGSAEFNWSWDLYRRNAEYRSAAGVLAGLALLWLKTRRWP